MAAHAYTFGAILLLTLGCSAPGSDDGVGHAPDLDGDGFAQGQDCDDNDAAAFPGATELCDAIDNDCNGLVDDAAVDASSWYRDTDADSFGDAGAAIRDCLAPEGYVADDTDCDDANAATFPGAPETCNGNDDDCDAVADESDAIDAATWFADADGDGFGDMAMSVIACDQPPDYVADATDCDDNNGVAFPGAPETCNGTDDDCDGQVDEAAALDARTWFADADGDGFGDSTASEVACDQPVGFVDEFSDCDDAAGATNPAATEVCNGIDDDCDTEVDEAEAADAGLWFADADGDGFGDAVVSELACLQPTGFVADSTDCDDATAAINPAALESCNGTDDDCDAEADEPDAVDALRWYADADADSYGDSGTSQLACSAPVGFVADASDCDDTAADVNAAATELCDGTDNNCDGVVDEASAADAITVYADADGDTYGDASASTVACDVSAGFVADSTDCDDASASISPGAAEVCSDGVDDDCSGLADDGCSAGAYTGDYGAAGGAGVSDADAAIYGPKSGDSVGEAIVSGLDVDGDGMDDTFVGASGYHRSTPSYGSVFGYYGFPSGVSSATTAPDADIYDYSWSYATDFPTGLWALDDFDGDGTDELAMSARYGSSSSGYYYTTFIIEGESLAGSWSPYTVGTGYFWWYAETRPGIGGPAGPIQGVGWQGSATGFDDIAITNYTDASSPGSIDLYDTLLASSAREIVGEDAGDYAGFALGGGSNCDTNGDGYDEVFVGAYGDDDSASDSGAIYVVEAPVTGTYDLSAAPVKIVGSAASDMLGYRIDSPGDTNGDG